MDRRCPRKLKNPPQEFCPSAIQHLRWRESLGREPTEHEEISAPGCKWSIRSHGDMFCFFKSISYEKDPLTDTQIAHLIGLSEPTVKKTRDKALSKLANMREFKEMAELYEGEAIVVERQVDPYEDSLSDMTNISSSAVLDEVMPTVDDIAN